ncbi:E3 ubiquitin-protein ligase HERC2 isoform X1 [Astyanax mexicanus]|uniref:E3 ubiquitin-protein ligase HERC2 isoform X1 n=2 Tax=Astyanax mexicanus TaxID=7994 RepID=A0A8T2M5K8_ASTMX|nr:E3 ubiquitin-protein ligase HERC2 isoform X1 [Astyanax mexicanus]
MPSPSFSLDAQLRFHDKWLKIDLQRAFSSEGLSEMWNEMVKDEEIVFDREESAYPGKSFRFFHRVPSSFFPPFFYQVWLGQLPL